MKPLERKERAIHLTLAGHPSRDELTILQELLPSGIHSLLYSDLGAPLPLHISLSRPVVLRTEQRSLFVETFEMTLRAAHLYQCVIIIIFCIS